MTAPSTASGRAASVSTFAAIRRLYPYARPAMPRIVLGMARGAARRAASPCSSRRCCARSSTVRCARATPRRSGRPSLLVLGLGVLEAVMIALRRWFVLTPGTHVEARMRNALYAQLQRPAGDLPRPLAERAAALARDERPQPDPPLDLVRPRAARRQRPHDPRRLRRSSCRSPGCSALLFMVCSIPLWIYGYVFESKYSVDRPAQPGPGRATSRRPSRSRCTASGCSRRSAAAATRCESFADQAERAARHRDREGEGDRRHLAVAAARARRHVRALPARRRVARRSAARSRVGELVAFFATATVLRFPVESIGFLLSMTFDTRTAIDRFFEVIDTANTITDPASPGHDRARPRGRLVFDDVHFRYQDSPRARPRPARRRRPRARARRDDGARRPHRLRQVHARRR